MKCECGESLNPWNVILPWRNNYKLFVVDDDGHITEKIRICERCYRKYEQLMQLIAQLGMDEVLQMLEEIGKNA